MSTATLLGRRKRRVLEEDEDWTPEQVDKLYKVRTQTIRTDAAPLGSLSAGTV